VTDPISVRSAELFTYAYFVEQRFRPGSATPFFSLSFSYGKMGQMQNRATKIAYMSN
jgi:hypothetical protein